MLKDIINIISKRDRYAVGSSVWNEWNEVKAKKIIEIKPSNDEEIVCFNESDLENIPMGFTHTNEVPEIQMHIENRAMVEYHPLKRHPIPYAIIKYGSKYFMILREKGSGEARLIGKKGLIGGHVGSEDIVKGDVKATLLNGLKREYLEEVEGVEPYITNIELKGIIKSNEGVDADHLGFVYVIEVNSDNFTSSEDGILSGIWIDETELENHKNEFESWLSIVYQEILK